MKVRYAQAVKIHSRMTLKACRVPVGADFHVLTGDQLEALMVEADRCRYRRPANANGSRLRYFHDLLQRRAK